MEPLVLVALVFALAGLWFGCTILLLSRVNIAERRELRRAQKLERMKAGRREGPTGPESRSHDRRPELKRRHTSAPYSVPDGPAEDAA